MAAHLQVGHLQPREQTDILGRLPDFGKFNKARQDRWVFGDRITDAFMHKFSWTNIVRHRTVRQGASPDDPALARVLPGLNRSTQHGGVMEGIVTPLGLATTGLGRWGIACEWACGSA